MTRIMIAIKDGKVLFLERLEKMQESAQSKLMGTRAKHWMVEDADSVELWSEGEYNEWSLEWITHRQPSIVFVSGEGELLEEMTNE